MWCSIEFKMSKQSSSILVFLKQGDTEIDASIAIGEGKILWSGQNGLEWIGKDEEQWDSVYLIKYGDIHKLQQATKRFREKNFEQIKLLAVKPTSKNQLRFIRFLMKYVFSRFSIEIAEREIDSDRIPKSDILPTMEQHTQVAEKHKDHPIVMVNLLDYYDEPLYPKEYDGKKGKDGLDAYNLYGKRVMKTVAKLGGIIEYMGKVESVLIGNKEEKWHEFAFMRYHTLDALESMFKVKENVDVAIHRDAGLKSTKVLAFTPMLD